MIFLLSFSHLYPRDQLTVENRVVKIQKSDFSRFSFFAHLHRQFPGKLEVLQQNGYGLRNQHASISQKRIFWSLQAFCCEIRIVKQHVVGNRYIFEMANEMCKSYEMVSLK
jgi:hypothetical protein